LDLRGEVANESKEKALQLLAELEATADDSSKQQLAAVRASLETAQQKGEGQDANDLRQQLQDMVVENSEFVSVMVHEIRKPMTSIRGYSDMLAKNIMGELNAMQQQFVDTIRNNIISMEQLVTDVSDISKLHSGRIKAEPKMEMFKNISMQLEKDLSEFAANRKVSLTFEIPQGLPLLTIDAVRVQKALHKLVENAIKYTHEGEGQVTVSAEGLGDKLRVVIKDNGIGMTEETQGHLGELFFRGDQELVTQTKGYGMGLPIVFACLDLVGGELSWQSKVDEGTTFEVLLPVSS
jgi:signal transduction histidine kinase